MFFFLKYIYPFCQILPLNVCKLLWELFVLSHRVVQLTHAIDSFNPRQIIAEPTGVTAHLSTLIDLTMVTDDATDVCSGIIEVHVTVKFIVSFRNYEIMLINFISWFFIYDKESVEDKGNFVNKNLIYLFVHTPIVVHRFSKPLVPWLTDWMIGNTTVTVNMAI